MVSCALKDEELRENVREQRPEDKVGKHGSRRSDDRVEHRIEKRIGWIDKQDDLWVPHHHWPDMNPSHYVKDHGEAGNPEDEFKFGRSLGMAHVEREKKKRSRAKNDSRPEIAPERDRRVIALKKIRADRGIHGEDQSQDVRGCSRAFGGALDAEVTDLLINGREFLLRLHIKLFVKFSLGIEIKVAAASRQFCFTTST